jgi:hypothetical protein
MSDKAHFFSVLFSVKNLATLVLAALCGSGAIASEKVSSSSAVTPIKLWNGNKTESRQQYDREILEAALKATSASHGNWKLQEDMTDYPLAADEASIFRSKGFDVFGTVAGNAKLANERKTLIPLPLMKGLLGYRILIIRPADKEKFAAIESGRQLQQLRMGIPSTWADAQLFRHNGYKVEEKGSFDDLFTRLENGEFDYVTFGANEVTGVYDEHAAKSGKLMVESTLLVFYPFPLVFYVNPDNKQLAERVTQGLQTITDNGELDKIFNRYFAEDLKTVNLPSRVMIKLNNPILPDEMANFKPSL